MPPKKQSNKNKEECIITLPPIVPKPKPKVSVYKKKKAEAEALAAVARALRMGSSDCGIMLSALRFK
jgi:hypothetical protein